jgi:hypothetical protein
MGKGRDDGQVAANVKVIHINSKMADIAGTSAIHYWFELIALR